MHKTTSILFIIGLGVILTVLTQQILHQNFSSNVGQSINLTAPTEVGSANIVTAVVLGYRALDTLGELTILFVAATSAGLVLGKRREKALYDPKSGFILSAAADLLFPLLLLLGIYIIAHGHLTPGGGFQGGAILAAAFFIPVLANPRTSVQHKTASIIEGLAGAAFIIIGLIALIMGGEFLQPMLSKGTLGSLFSAGTLPLLYIAVGLKVGSELASLLSRLSEAEGID